MVPRYCLSSLGDHTRPTFSNPMEDHLEAHAVEEEALLAAVGFVG